MTWLVSCRIKHAILRVSAIIQFFALEKILLHNIIISSHLCKIYYALKHIIQFLKPVLVECSNHGIGLSSITLTILEFFLEKTINESLQIDLIWIFLWIVCIFNFYVKIGSAYSNKHTRGIFYHEIALLNYACRIFHIWTLVKCYCIMKSILNVLMELKGYKVLRI